MKTLSVVIACLLLITNTARLAHAAPSQSRAEKVKAGVARLGTGTPARVQVKLLDGTKLRGYVKEAGDDGFVIVERKTGSAIPVAYAQVKSLGGVGMSTGTKVAIGFGIAGAAFLTLALIALHYSD